MIFINLDELEPLIPLKWLEEAKKFLDKLEKEIPDEEKSEYISKRSSHWRNLKPTLINLLGHKCWYCETLESRSYMDVDHFRPKGGVIECPDHPGYWWLAFDWRNYRLSCNLCNRPHKDDNNDTLGKHNHFPLAEGSDWCRNPFENILSEQILLLDPTVKEDVALLEFLPNGEVHPRIKDPISLEYNRARTAINVYDLKSPALNDNRAKHYFDIQSWFRDLDCFYLVLNNNPDDKNREAAEGQIENIFKKIHDSVQSSAAYAAVAREMVASIHPQWLEEMLK